MAAGITAGTVAASAPVIYGVVRNMMPRPLGEHDYLHTENGCFYTRDGAMLCLRGLNLNDELFFFKKDGMDLPATNYDIFDAFEERFGRYGARRLIQTYNENFVSAADLKFLRKLGANCVRVPLRYRNLFRKENCKGDIDFDYLDTVIENCRKSGLYVILDLHSAPGYQNNDSASPRNGESILFDSSKAAFEARNSVVRLWTQIASHYKDEPSIAAFDLLNRPLNKVANWKEKADTLNKFYLRLYKAIRTVDPDRILIMQSPHSVDELPAFDKPLENVAYGLYSRFSTTFETDALIGSIRNIKERNIPVVICKLRAEENAEYPLTSLCDCGVSWLYGDFKGTSGSNCLYTGNPDPADFDTDNFDAITEKWTKPLTSKNFTLNQELSAMLKSCFGYGYVTVSTPEREAENQKHKPKFKVGFGNNLIIGNHSPFRSAKLKVKKAK